MTDTVTLPEGIGGRLVLSAADYKRDRAKWLTARRSGLGASETAAILGLNSYKTPLDVWLEKTSTEAAVDSETSEAAAWGNIFEAPVARRTVAKYPELGKLVPTPGLLAHEEHDWMLATIDYGLAARGRRYAPVHSLLEVKTTSRENYRLNWLEGVPPASIQVQCQQQMAVTGQRETWVTCFIGGEGAGAGKLAEPFRVERSDAVIEQIVNYAGLWWNDHIIGGVRPEPTFADHSKMGLLFPADDAADSVTASPDLVDTVALLIDAKRRVKEAEADEERAAFKLKDAMRERIGIKTAGGDVLVTWKEQTQKKFDQAAFDRDHPELSAEYKKPRTTRVLRPKYKKEQ